MKRNTVDVGKLPLIVAISLIFGSCVVCFAQDESTWVHKVPPGFGSRDDPKTLERINDYSERMARLEAQDDDTLFSSFERMLADREVPTGGQDIGSYWAGRLAQEQQQRSIASDFVENGGAEEFRPLRERIQYLSGQARVDAVAEFWAERLSRDKVFNQRMAEIQAAHQRLQARIEKQHVVSEQWRREIEEVAGKLLEERGREFRVTSRQRTSSPNHHFFGAVDFRSNDISKGARHKEAKKLSKRLGKNHLVVVEELEGDGTQTNTSYVNGKKGSVLEGDAVINATHTHVQRRKTLLYKGKRVDGFHPK